MKVYKGYELMEKAMKGEININQKVNSLSEDYKDCTLKFVLNDTAIHVMGLNFELIEDKTIDIDSIEELEEKHFITTGDDTDRTEFVKRTNKIITDNFYLVNDIIKNQNKLIKSVKQLSKEIQSIKEKM